MITETLSRQMQNLVSFLKRVTAFIKKHDELEPGPFKEEF